VRIKSRWLYFSGLMALVIGLMLWALPVIAAPSAAVTGSVTLDKNHYSDKSTAATNYNIVKFTVADTDLSSVRTGIARFASATTSVLKVGSRTLAILEGELGKTDTFSGNGTKTTFALTYVPEDADADGTRDEIATTAESLTTKDLVVKLSGIIQSSSLVSLRTDSTSSSIVFATAPAAGTDNVTAAYEYSEFNQLGATGTESPISSVTQTLHDTTAYITQTFAVSGDVTLSQTTTGSLNKIIKITFQYNVAENIAKIVSLSSPTAVGQDRVRKITGKERNTADAIDALSNKFVGKAALFQLADFNKIESEAGDVAGNDADSDGTVQVDEMNGSTGLESTLAKCNTANSLCDRVARATAALFPGVASNTVKATAFRDLTLPVADGETVTATYTDASPVGSRTDTAIVDLTAPVIGLVGPSHKFYSSATLVTVEANITDAGSGLAIGDVDVASPSAGSWSATVKSPISGGFRLSRSASGALSEGNVTWNVTATDKVGNAPKATDSRTAPQKLRAVANPAALGTSGNKYSFYVDTAPPSLDTGAATDTTGIKTGGSVDVRLTTAASGTHTSPTTSATVLTDSAADFVTGKVKIGDVVKNLTDGSYGTLTAVTANTVTVSALTCKSSGCDNDFDQNDSYTVTNPNLGVVVRDDGGNKLTTNVTVVFALGAGQAPLDASTVSAADFDIGGVTPASVTVGKVSGSGSTKVQGVLITLASAQGTDAKPLVGLPVANSISDSAGNKTKQVDATTTPAAKKAKDGLVPAISGVTVTGEIAGRAASRNKITVNITTSEATQTPTGFARYLKLGTSPDTTAIEDSSKSKSLSFTSSGTNTWTATFDIDDASGTGTPLSGLLNVRATALDPAGNTGSTGTSNPDGTDGKLKGSALLVEFDNVLNKGNAPTFVISPEVGSKTPPETNSTNPFITVKFTDEAKEYEITSLTGDLKAKADSHDTVDITSALLTNPDGTITTVNYKASSATNFVVAMTGAALGEYTLKIQAKDSLGNNRKARPTTAGADTAAETFSYKFKVVARAKYSIALDPGNNLMSLPGDPADGDINVVIAATDPIDLVLTYDASDAAGPWLIAERNTATGKLEGNLTTMDAGHAYWVQTTAFHTLKVDVPPQAFSALPPTIAVTKGWNLVPTNDLTRRVVNTAIDADDYYTGLKWTVTYTYETSSSKWWRVLPSKTGSTVNPTCKDAAGTESTETAKACTTTYPLLLGLDTGLAIGKGYWVWVTEDGTLVP